MNKSRPGGVVRKTTKAGIGGGAILVGILLYYLFRGFGSGGTGASGTGTGAADGDGTAMISTVPVGEAESGGTSAAEESDAGGLTMTADERKALSGNVLTVLIDEHDYRIEVPGTPDAVYRPVPLDRIVELAAAAQGDSNGIHVRILRRESARASSEERLKLELARKGIHNDAIVMPGELIP